MALLSKKLLRFKDGGLLYFCPGCNEAHKIYVDGTKRPVWGFDGNVDAPTFAPSVNVVGHCHHFVKNGTIGFLNDCTHALAGQTVPLPDMPQDELDFWNED